MNMERALTGGYDSPRFYRGTLLLIGLWVVFTSFLTPPLQSPDEWAHIKRTYQVSDGHILPVIQDGVTGGYVDTGLLAYIESFADISYHGDRKIQSDRFFASKQLDWSNERVFSPFPNTSVTSFVVYLPQAAGLWIGRHSGLSIYVSYSLSRILNATCVLLLFYLGSRFCPLPLPHLIIALFPMTLFQLASTSADGMVFGLASLTGALVAAKLGDSFRWDSPRGIILLVAWASLISAKLNQLPMLFLIYLAGKPRTKTEWACVTTALFAILTWIVYASTHNHDPMMPDSQRAREMFIHYLSHPLETFGIVLRTLGSEVDFYWKSFVGYLGWLDAPIPLLYIHPFALLILMSIYFAHQNIKSKQSATRILIFIGLPTLITLWTFVLFLVTWSGFPTDTIKGVQGRYFIPIALFSSYYLIRPGCTMPSVTKAKWLLAGAAALSIAGMVPTLLKRYWIEAVI